jgi:hypothetical protein
MPKHRTRAIYFIAPCDGSVTWVEELKCWVSDPEWYALRKPGGGHYSFSSFRIARTAKRAFAKARGCPAPSVEVCARFYDKKYRGPEGTIIREKVWYLR